MDDFIIRALLAGLAIAIIAGPLGVFVLWRRMAYFGDTLSHSAILGVALGFLLSIHLNVGILASTLTVAVLLILSERQKSIGSDTILGIMAHSALSLGIILISFVKSVRVNIDAWLFGDILAISWNDVWLISAALIIVSLIMFFIWNDLLSITVHEDLARVEGVRVGLISAIYTILIAILVAVAMKVVGAFLVTALLLIPAAAARKLSKTPEQMAILAIVSGIISVFAGLTASFLWDTPAGPSIVMAATGLFLLSQLLIQ